ncbi:50S ribosomal protein L6 [archaeon]|nr:50S ribosomal protein L6 [archaeon]|tara:strand:- start:2366 stop:2914 length:549 start_codon:yes stop_codon:yes gene_type:complete
MKLDINEQIEIPEKVTVEIDKSLIKLKGEKGEIERRLVHPRVDISQKDNAIILTSKKATKREKTMTNTFKAHIKNMVKGVQEGFTYKLKICSGHFPMNVSVQNNELIIKNFYGEKKPRTVNFPETVSVKVEGEEITVEGVSKELVGQTASKIEEVCKRNRRSFDKRVFQSGIYLISKDGKEI